MKTVPGAAVPNDHFANYTHAVTNDVGADHDCRYESNILFESAGVLAQTRNVARLWEPVGA